jgi:predicted nucleotidyltransferase component of viral defense system
MKSKKDLEGLRSTLGLNIWQIERDYLQHLFLFFLSRHDSGNFIFKGGTALQKLYGLNRFSVDLDFTLRGINSKPIVILEEIKKDFNNFGFNSNIKINKKKESITSNIKIKGPLHVGTDKSISSLKIEISMREKILTVPERKEIIPIYDDIPSYFVLIMSLEEILAEKIRAIMTRSKARDVYDIWFLLRKNVKINKEIVNEKLKFYNKSFDKKLLISNIKTIGKVWETELKPLVTFIPDFKTVSKEIEESMNRSFHKNG